MRNHRLGLAQFLGIVLAIAAPFYALAADVGTGAKITTGTPIMLQAPDAGATVLTTTLLVTTAQTSGLGARIAVSHTVATLMTAGMTGYRKSIALQNFDATQGLFCGFTSAVTITTAAFYVPAKSSATVPYVPGSWAGDFGLNTPIYCLAETGNQTNPTDTGVVEAQ